MNSLGYVLMVAALAFVAFYVQRQWTRTSGVTYRNKVKRTMETYDDIKSHAKEFNAKEVLKVTDDIYVAIGFALANSIMIVGPDGIVIVDVTESYEAGAEVLEAFRKITDKPVTDIIYTHNHADHVFGAKAFVEDPANPPNVWAHASIVKGFDVQISKTALAYYTRAMRQFGVFLPELSAGIGFKLRFGKEGSTMAPLYPNKMVEGKEANVTLAGIPMKIVHIPGETDDQIGVWLPHNKAFLCADDLYKAFPNLYAIRGTRVRSQAQWVTSMDTMIDLEPEVLIPSHTRPVYGKDKIVKLLTEYRDAIQYVNDQTIRLMNYGYHPDEIANMLQLPSSLVDNPFLKEFYGTVAWSAKSTFIEYLGWFSGDAVELNPLTRSEKAERMIKLVGEEKLIDTGRDALRSGDFQWAAELSSYVLRNDPTNADARDIKVEALAALGARQISTNGRNYYLTSALEVANDVKINTPGPENRAGFVEEFPISMSLDLFSVLFRPETCEEKNETVYIELTEPASHHFIQIRHSVAIVRHTVPKQWDLKLKCSETVYKDIMLQRKNTLVAVAVGDVVIEGGTLAIGSFFDCFDKAIEQIRVL